MIMVILVQSSCKKETPPYEQLSDSKENAVVSIVKSNGNMQNLTIFPYQDEARTIDFGASFGGVGLPASNISVKYAVDDKAFDSLNVSRVAQGLAPFQKFPADSYTLGASSSIIPAGQVSSNLIKVSYFPKKFNDKIDYLLPISVVDASGYKIGAGKTLFLIAPKLTDILASKVGWSVTASSQELVGEGSANGKADFVIDGNTATYWHSKYIAPAAAYPHWLNIDMKTDIYVTRVDLIARQNATNGFVLFNIEGSKDGLSWTSLGDNLVFDPFNKGAQSYPVTPNYSRFIKVTGLKAASASTAVSHLAEMNVYRY